MSRARRRAPAVLLVVLLPSLPSAAQAAFTARPAAVGPSIGSATEQPVPSISATCANAGPTATASVTWTASPSRTSSYALTWSGSSTGSASPTASPASVTGLSKGGTYTFTVKAVLGNWSSAGRTTAAVAC